MMAVPSSYENAGATSYTNAVITVTVPLNLPGIVRTPRVRTMNAEKQAAAKRVGELLEDAIADALSAAGHDWVITVGWEDRS